MFWMLMAPTLTGLLPAGEAFLGFGNDAVILIMGLLILTAALLPTGVVEMAGPAAGLRLILAPVQ